MTIFADDSTVLFTYNDQTNIHIDINNTLTSLIQWLTLNNLTINLTKTHLINFKQRNNNPLNFNISYDGNLIKEVVTTKFLGLTMDNKLTWKPHIENLIIKLNQFSYALHKLRKVASI